MAIFQKNLFNRKENAIQRALDLFSENAIYRQFVFIFGFFWSNKF
ncbi:hypothetical protein SAMN05421780_103257 [Flexibacter flexilis DSM 6793]|uniref:Uncharacterized protein n=1 Tax=Flexibacter flexilis DSM 6793 TaxID=927664 RepID=A0A1I1HG81_9BACT|nr:hypothetical protein SAMN05421780_103257 [Flexibacter flexilis DSM 6793]